MLQLCDGASVEERARWFLKPAQEFRYLNQSTCFDIPGDSNAEEYQVSRNADAQRRVAACSTLPEPHALLPAPVWLSQQMSARLCSSMHHVLVTICAKINSSMCCSASLPLLVIFMLQRTITAMTKVGILPEQREAIFATVAAVLHLGNITFVEGREADSSKVDTGKAQQHLQAAGGCMPAADPLNSGHGAPAWGSIHLLCVWPVTALKWAHPDRHSRTALLTHYGGHWCLWHG